MSKNQSINVYFHNETDGDKTPVSTASSPSGTASAVPVSQQKAERKKEQGAFVAGVVAVQQIKPYVDQVIGFKVSQIEATTGSAELQQRAQIVSGAVSAVASIGMGAVVGGVPGAIVSTALTVLTSSISAVQTTAAINNSRRIERENLQRRKSALGQSVNRSRSGGTV